MKHITRVRKFEVEKKKVAEDGKRKSQDKAEVEKRAKV